MPLNTLNSVSNAGALRVSQHMVNHAVTGCLNPLKEGAAKPVDGDQGQA